MVDSPKKYMIRKDHIHSHRPDARRNQCEKIQPEGIDSRGMPCRNNRVSVVIILCPGAVALARVLASAVHILKLERYRED
ncbi:hypothetical protein AVEN_261092-1 [Araneus ventricosus]|uniref:Uncharacterized protein n=2 Tax=Araneus ventricosus TaxID=182803 RepID=A0A4Y2MAG7_ARAVE|nr:hypothetical protein AVEN_94858-1 [Araneus ventricosus]GBN23471.1 hypothetical protein AVEN_261092-1 [Araneus ventricosus]